MPIRQLVGQSLEGGWDIVELIEPEPTGTGGSFSVRYKVRNQAGKEAFLKAMDFSAAFQSQDLVASLSDLLNEYRFERDLYTKCSVNGLSRVVTPLGNGEVSPPVPTLLGKIPYIIFEMADGDLRSQSITQKFSSLEWVLRSLHQTTTGVKQLHQNLIAHQDLKPSNVLVFNSDGAKIADLGRASDKTTPFRYDDMVFSGDPSHAPIEKLLGVPYQEFEDRFATDLYLLGSLIFYQFLGVHMTALYLSKLGSINPNWIVSTYQECLPQLEHAFAAALADLHAHLSQFGPQIANEIVDIARQLCAPDPLRRGYSQAKSKRAKYDLHRYITRFDVLANKARLHESRR